MTPANSEWKKIVEILNLEPLEGEGGYFRRTFDSQETMIVDEQKNSRRSIQSAILFLVTSDNFSALHRLKSNSEVFHFCAGSKCKMLQITPSGEARIMLFGSDVFSGFVPQVSVPKMHWQGLKVIEQDGWALMGTTVSPAFEYTDFELGNRTDLLSDFPQLKELIVEFTRQ